MYKLLKNKHLKRFITGFIIIAMANILVYESALPLDGINTLATIALIITPLVFSYLLGYVIYSENLEL
tara:strand:+ start:10512 stop:10715 length:204 start_codon:yes stop_codon:yes gene_type:complete